MNIIDERDVRTVYRKLRKKEFDEMMRLSTSADEVRLLDEGMVVDAYGNPLFYIMKGTLEKYLDALPDDYEGSINLGHMDFATFPFILGKWTKKDFSLVDIGDGRKGLNVRLNLDNDSFIVKELRRASYDLGVSAEFGYHINERFSEEYGIEILDEVFISDFAIVGEAGNVNSSGIRLKGEKMAVDVKDLATALEGEQPDLSDLTKKLDALLEEQTEEAADAVLEAVEETITEEVEETTEEVTEEATEDTVEVQTEALNYTAVLQAVDDLKSQVEELKAQNASLTAELAAKRQAEADFIGKFKELSISLVGKKKEEAAVKTEIVYTDGIGE